jgi:cation diffusion facilitator family transporter
MLVNEAKTRTDAGRRWAIISIAGSSVLAILNTTAGLLSNSTSVTAAGFEFAGDVLASLIVFLGMLMASRPPDEDHPYGHGRFEILAGLLVGLILVLAGAVICVHSLS